MICPCLHELSAPDKSEPTVGNGLSYTVVGAKISILMIQQTSWKMSDSLISETKYESVQAGLDIFVKFAYKCWFGHLVSKQELGVFKLRMAYDSIFPQSVVCLPLNP